MQQLVFGSPAERGGRPDLSCPENHELLGSEIDAMKMFSTATCGKLNYEHVSSIVVGILSEKR